MADTTVHWLNLVLAAAAGLVAFGSFNKMQSGKTRPCLIWGMLLVAVGLIGQWLGLWFEDWLKVADTALYGGLLAVLLASQRTHSWVLERFANPAASIACWIAGAVLVLGLVTGCTEARAQGNTKPDIVEIIEVSGEIHAATASGMRTQVEKINEQPRIKAVVLVMDSPGGGALASSALYEAIGEIKAPVVAWCQYLCASGGVYAVMAPSVKHILVRPDTITGSVGVIMQAARYHRLLNWAKVDIETYKSGALKDAGNATRAAEDSEKKYLQSIIDDLAVKFYDIVGQARGKKIDVQAWEQIKSARIFIGPQAVTVGLVDGVGSREDAIKKAKELSGSKLVFTREELKKMSKDANETTVYHAPTVQPVMVNPLGDTAWLIELMKEIRQGESISFHYKLPLKF